MIDLQYLTHDRFIVHYVTEFMATYEANHLAMFANDDARPTHTCPVAVAEAAAEDAWQRVKKYNKAESARIFERMSKMRAEQQARKKKDEEQTQ